MVQWLGLCAFTDNSAGLIPEKGIKISQAVWCSQKIGKEVQYQWLLTLQKRYNLTLWERHITMKGIVFQKKKKTTKTSKSNYWITGSAGHRWTCWIHHRHAISNTEAVEALCNKPPRFVNKVQEKKMKREPVNYETQESYQLIKTYGPYLDPKLNTHTHTQ